MMFRVLLTYNELSRSKSFSPAEAEVFEMAGSISTPIGVMLLGEYLNQIPEGAVHLH